MKKLLLILSIFSVFILTACKSDAEKAGEDYATEAFQALKDEFNQDVTIKDADYACATAVIEGENESTCTYVVRLDTEGANQIIYAFVVVSDDDNNDPFTHVQLYGKEEDYTGMLDLIYSGRFQNETRDDMAADETIEEFDFVVDTLSRKEINKAYDGVE